MRAWRCSRPKAVREPCHKTYPVITARIFGRAGIRAGVQMARDARLATAGQVARHGRHLPGGTTLSCIGPHGRFQATTCVAISTQ